MPRANRSFIPGHVWHITHRCHQRQFLLKFVKDRACWCHWLFEAKKRYGLSVLNFVVTSNHIHLLVHDTGNNVIPNSMQLIAGRVAQAYNRRKNRKGAFWEDRYHATAVETNQHLIECMIYIDLNMVRAGVVSHPSAWLSGGFYEIQNYSERYKILDIEALLDLSGINNLSLFQEAHLRWVNSKLKKGMTSRESQWSDSLAVGNEIFIENIKTEMGYKAKSRKIIKGDGSYCIKEEAPCYAAHLGTKKAGLKDENA